MLKQLKAKTAASTMLKTVNQLIANQNAIIAELRGGSKTQEEVDAIHQLFEEQE